MDLMHHYIVGDIHGCLSELQDLEKAIQRHAGRRKARPLIVSVGDLVDRGPDSAGCVRHVRLGVEAGTYAAVMGNHEIELLANLAEFAPQTFTKAGCSLPAFRQRWRDTHGVESFGRELSYEDYVSLNRLMWLGQGGVATMKSFGCEASDVTTWRIDAADLRFLVGLPLVWENEQVVVTHAFATDAALAAGRSYDATGKPEANGRLLHSLIWSRKKPKTRPDKSKLHVSGHTPLIKSRLYKSLASLQIDTGCVYGRRLTAYCVETAEMLRVSAKRAGGYY